MRHVFTNRELPHLWAYGRQNYGRNSNDSFYFRGDVIYSYGQHFPIAKRFGIGRYAFTTEDYSSTTAQHKSLVRRSIPHDAKVVLVPNPERDPAEMLDQVMLSIASLLESADKRRKEELRQADRAVALSRAEDFNTYAEWCESDVRIDTAPIAGGDLDALRAAIQRREDERAAAEKAAAEKAAIELAEKIEAWRRHDPTVKSHYIFGATALRIGSSRGTYRTGGLLPDRGSEGRQVVETSRGAEIPVEDARRLWPLIQRVMAGDRDYEVGMELGGYRLTKIRRDGSIVVGCHDIPYREIEHIARELGLLESSEVAA